MTIPLPPLPETKLTLPYPDDDEPVYTVFQVRAIQREAMRVAIEVAARECGKQCDGVFAAPVYCARAIRALEIGAPALRED